MKRSPSVAGALARASLLALLLGCPLATAALAEPGAVDLGPGRVVLVPPNLGVRAEPLVEPGIEPVWQEILEHFSARGGPTTALERSSAAALWNEVMVEVQASGQADIYRAYALFARRVAEQLEYSSIVFPSLVTRAARLLGQSASWDGVRRRVDSPLVGSEAVGSVTGPDLLVSREGVRGRIAAASLHVAVLGSDGELRFEGAGGLALLQRLDHGEHRDDAELGVALRADAFSESAELREGIGVAFRKPLPASRAR